MLSQSIGGQPIQQPQPIPSSIIGNLQAERAYQLSLDWSYAFDDKNTASDWLSYLTVYMGRAVSDSDKFRENMLKVATLAIAAVEAVDRNNGIAPSHYNEPSQYIRKVERDQL